MENVVIIDKNHYQLMINIVIQSIFFCFNFIDANLYYFKYKKFYIINYKYVLIKHILISITLYIK